MYYLYSWIVDHIENKKKANSLGIIDLQKIIGNHIAEIEYIKELKINSDLFTIAEVIEKNSDSIMMKSLELDKTIILPFRENIYEAEYFIVKNNNIEDEWQWTTISDFGGIKDSLIPAISVNHDEIFGNWKDIYLKKDYLIKIDNKSIGNRPDLLCHRGLAREIAFFIDSEVVSDENICDERIQIKNIDNIKDKNIKNILKINTNDVYFACVSQINNIHESVSHLFYALRLATVDVKPKSFLVDLSNYVMFDIGHPMHVFDKNKINEFIEFRNANDNEELILIDKEKIILNKEDIIIVDKKEPLSLAGIMGGNETSVNMKTSSILLEAALFNNKNIKNSSKNHNKRSESSTRFEKILNKENVLIAVKRFITLLFKKQDFFEAEVIYYGKLDEPYHMFIMYDEIISLIGESISPEIIYSISKGLGFEVSILQLELGLQYKIIVPFWRSDIRIKEDFIEEISRFIGYNNIQKRAPFLLSKDSGLNKNYKLINNIIFNIKNFCKINAFNELLTHGIVNSEVQKIFSNEIKEEVIYLKNNYSEFQEKLAYSLIPECMNKIINYINSKPNELEKKAFEISSIWKENENGDINEELVFAFVLYNNKNDKFNFYKNKEIVENLFKYLNPEKYLKWNKFNKDDSNVYFSDIASALYLENNFIGTVGFFNPEIIYNKYKIEGSFFIGEIKINSLIKESDLSFKLKNNLYNFNIAFLFKKNNYIFDLIDEIKTSIEEIEKIEIVDWFEKNDWIDVRSITLRFYLKNNTEPSSYQKILYKCKDFIRDKECTIR